LHLSIADIQDGILLCGKFRINWQKLENRVSQN